MTPILRAEAKAAGLTRYFTGKPCLLGHVCERTTSSGSCIECGRHRRNPEYMKREREVYRENRRADRQRYYKKSIAGMLRKKIIAIKRRAVVTLKVADVLGLWNNQGGLCALSGFPMKLRPGEYDHHSASLDRIKPSLGYSPGNVRWVTTQANNARGSGTDAELLAFCQSVLEKRGAIVTW